MFKNLFFKNFHFWHIVHLSPWPILLSFNILPIPLGLVLFFQGYYYGLFFFYMSLFFVIYSLLCWFYDITFEGTFEGCHTKPVKRNLAIGMILFIFSEIMFFVSFFWAFFWSSFSPSMEIGLVWPCLPRSLLFNPWGIPFLNTYILLWSGFSVTICHNYLKDGDFEESLYFGLATVFAGFLFLFFQFYEYKHARFDFSMTVYGSIFFICTGFHGLHVIIGVFFISLMLVRLFFYHFSPKHHFGFEAACWYWHFVDVVWLFLFITIYVWGYNLAINKLFI